MSTLEPAEVRAARFAPPRANRPRRVVVALSGGVDSSVAAWLLVQAGHEVIGASLRLTPDGVGAPAEGRCCSVDDLRDARRVADALGVPFHAIDARARFFDAVMRPFAEAYRQGLTPIPCLACNHEIKLGDLLGTARSLGAALATGHYARKVVRDGRAALARPFDRARDQTYWLYGTPAGDLDELELPLGELDKPLVRALARKAGLPVADKPDSQEICFVHDGDHAAAVERIGGKGASGEVVDATGASLRPHDGVHRFTVGQRRGVGVSSAIAGERRYVVDVDGGSGRVVLGDAEGLRVRRVRAAPLRLAQPLAAWPEVVQLQVRARHAAQPARWRVIDDGLELVAEQPIRGVALGQAAVCWHDDVLLGGGLLVERDGPWARAQTLDLALEPPLDPARGR
ncbi:MAG: tRNA 2-thiouridine(34) synthase MnmA [Deltaproteobacteria bacterium]|nr:tRNA 2-thiouridine(34) synthase MnmA [Deltaproteobacteria bacterium]